MLGKRQIGQLGPDGGGVYGRKKGVRAGVDGSGFGRLWGARASAGGVPGIRDGVSRAGAARASVDIGAYQLIKNMGSAVPYRSSTTSGRTRGRSW